jgi:enoyl-CoA hydratase/carnithine racemase
MSTEIVLQETRGAVRIITMNRPEKKNAFNNALYHAMAKAIGAATADDAVRALLITGAGNAFSAGQDISEMSIEAGAELGFPTFMNALIACDKPVLTAVNGVGVGIGLTMLLHTDINYIGESARLRAPFVTLGVVPEAASSLLLPDVIGYQRAAEILFTARWIAAAETVELGLTFAMVEDSELLATALAKATEIAANPPQSMRHTKSLLKIWKKQAIVEARAREDEAFAQRLASAENAEAVRMFFERRRG